MKNQQFIEHLSKILIKIQEEQEDKENQT